MRAKLFARARFFRCVPVTHTGSRRRAELDQRRRNAAGGTLDEDRLSWADAGFNEQHPYAVSHAVPIVAASANERPAGFGSALRAARHVVGETCLVLLGSSVRFGSRCRRPAIGHVDDRVQNHFGAVVPGRRAVAAEIIGTALA